MDKIYQDELKLRKNLTGVFWIVSHSLRWNEMKLCKMCPSKRSQLKVNVVSILNFWSRSNYSFMDLVKTSYRVIPLDIVSYCTQRTALLAHNKVKNHYRNRLYALHLAWVAKIKSLASWPYKRMFHSKWASMDVAVAQSTQSHNSKLHEHLREFAKLDQMKGTEFHWQDSGIDLLLYFSVPSINRHRRCSLAPSVDAIVIIITIVPT